jgi:EamA-like transporter family
MGFRANSCAVPLGQSRFRQQETGRRTAGLCSSLVRMHTPTKREYFCGALYGLAAVIIWAAFIVASRFGVRANLTPWDVAAIRFGVAGILLLPYLMRNGLALDRLGLLGLAAITAGCGAPMVCW